MRPRGLPPRDSLSSRPISVIWGFLDQDTIEVKVNGELWKKVASLYDLAQGEKGYYVRTSITDGVDVVFGNGFHGAIPYEGQAVEVKYLLHDGESGNISDARETFLFRNLLMDDNGDEVDGNLLLNCDWPLVTRSPEVRMPNWNRR